MRRHHRRERALSSDNSGVSHDETQPQCTAHRSTGRGHALADLFQRTDPTVQVFYGPGNSSVVDERICTVSEISLVDPASAVRFCQTRSIDFVFVSHVEALSAGYVDFLKASGIATIGPSWCNST
ncbi:hypothetical protein [Mesorhizobium sp. M0040]|uniref:hypothetical protein n=1 Tax=Mesorhizobium sp. M0040 TaxID=2956855 RepID=UPI00333B2556